jgi:hypothetical protein
MEKSAFTKQIESLRTEVESRLNGQEYIGATKEDVRALRLLSGLLSAMFGPFANVDLGDSK